MARAQQLLDELKQLGEQRQQVHFELCNRISKAVAKLGAAPIPAAITQTNKTSGGKRAAGQGPAPDGKRQRTGQEVDERMEAIWKTCAKLIARLWSLKNAQFFHAPVNAQAARGYYDIIKNPMDFTTIKRKLGVNGKPRVYTNPMDFLSDVRLVFGNCRTYNTQDTEVAVAGVNCSDAFERLWRESGVEEVWHEVQYSRDPNSLAPHQTISHLSRKLKSITQLAPLETLPDTSRDMTFVEKRKLSIQIGDLQGDQLPRVLDIISEGMPELDTGNGDEVEVDIEALPPATLWALRSYVDALHSGTGHHHQQYQQQHAHFHHHHPPSLQHQQQQQAQFTAAAAVKPQQTAAGTQGPVANGRGPSPAFGGNGHDASDAAAARDTAAGQGGASSPSGSGSGQDSPQEVKGSTMDDTSKPVFHRDTRPSGVDESQTAPHAPQFVTDKSNKPKADNRPLNTAAWANLTVDDGAGSAKADDTPAHDGDDELFANFRTIEEEQQKKKAEEERKREEAEKRRLEEVARAEEEERKLAEAEEAEKARALQAREDDKARELNELKNMANTAQLTHQDEMHQTLAQLTHEPEAMKELGLVYKDEDDGMNFEDDDE